MRQLAVEADAVSFLELVPRAGDIDTEMSIQHDDDVLAFVTLRRSALCAGIADEP